MSSISSIHRVRRERASRPGDIPSVLGFHAIHVGALGGVRLFVVVAERDDELRMRVSGSTSTSTRSMSGGALAAGGGVLEIELLAHLEKAELAERR